MVIKGFVESNTYQNEILQKVKISPGKIVPCLRVVSKNNKINEFNELSDWFGTKYMFTFVKDLNNLLTNGQYNLYERNLCKAIDR